MSRKTPEPIPVAKLSTLSMVAGEEKKTLRVIDEDEVKEWVGFGWITLRTATSEDRKTIPAVQR